jgi:hypothetical protein
MEYCPICQSEEIELMDEEDTGDGITIDAYYACLDCNCAWIEHIMIEIIDEGTGIEI